MYSGDIINRGDLNSELKLAHYTNFYCFVIAERTAERTQCRVHGLRFKVPMTTTGGSFNSYVFLSKSNVTLSIDWLNLWTKFEWLYKDGSRAVVV